MRRIIIALAILLSLSFTSGAEGFGLVGGFTSSRMELKNLSLKSVAGFHAGVTYKIPVVAGLVIQPELMYNVKGAKLSEINCRCGYIELPVQVQYGVDLIVLRPYVFVEPFMGYALSSSVNVASVTTTTDAASMNSRFEYGVSVGAGTDLFKHFQLSFKYFWNLEQGGLKSNIKELGENILSGKSFDGLNVTLAYFF